MKNAVTNKLISLVAVLCLGLNAGSSSGRAEQRFPELIVPQGFGANIHFTDARPGEMEMLAASGMTWIRMDFIWGATERKRGEYDFSAYDRLVRSLEKHNIRALFILDYGNQLYDEGLAPYTDEGRQAFARWAVAGIKRFRGRGILWEMWNEPNIFFWKPKPNVEDYIKLAREVGRAIRQEVPEELYIGPATSQIDLKFLEDCFKGGLLEYWDAVSVHPYRQTAPETALPEYQKLRELIDKYAPAGKKIPILSGEWGYSAVWKNYDVVRQGKYLPRQWLTNLVAGVPVSIWYDWHDDGPDPKEPEHHFGMVAFPYFEGRNPVYDPKPAYLAARTLCTLLKGYRFVGTVPPQGERAADCWVLKFEKEGQTAFAAWCQKDGETITISAPLSRGNYRVYNHLGEEQGTLSVEKDLSPLTVTDAPQYLIPQ